MRRLLIGTAVVIIAIPLVLISWLTIVRWREKGPDPPETIPSGDYTHAIEYTQFKSKRLMETLDLPSLAVALIDDQDTVFQESLGTADIEHNRPATSETIYKLWSLAKPFTGLEVMRLAEDGLIDLDTPIANYLPGFSIQSRFPDSDPITARSLLTHRAGLPRNGCQWVPFQSPGAGSLETLANSLERCHQIFPVGTRYKYSNIGFDLLGLLVQEMRGEDFAQTMKRRFLDPIGMTSSAFVTADLPPGSVLAPGYEYYQGDYYPMAQGDITNLPSGNLYSTIEDLGRFIKFIHRGGTIEGRQPLIQPETLADMFSQQPSGPADPQPMGLGWKLNRAIGSELMIWHDGGPTDGTGVLMAFLPKRKLGVVFIANEISFDGGHVLPVAVEILEIMLQTRYGVQYTDEEAAEVAPPSQALLDTYVGKYIIFNQPMNVLRKGDQLKLRFPPLNISLVPEGENRFHLDHWLLDLGLDDLFKLPIDVRKVAVEFHTNPVAGDDVLLIVDFDGLNYEICPSVPSATEFPEGWDGLIGVYERHPRLAGDAVGDAIWGKAEILLDDGVLQMSGYVGSIQPVDDRLIIIPGGLFAGESITRNPATGYLTHQGHIYIPVETGD